MGGRRQRQEPKGPHVLTLGTRQRAQESGLAPQVAESPPPARLLALAVCGRQGPGLFWSLLASKYSLASCGHLNLIFNKLHLTFEEKPEIPFLICTSQVSNAELSEARV